MSRGGNRAGRAGLALTALSIAVTVILVLLLWPHRLRWLPRAARRARA